MVREYKISRISKKITQNVHGLENGSWIGNASWILDILNFKKIEKCTWLLRKIFFKNIIGFENVHEIETVEEFKMF